MPPVLEAVVKKALTKDVDARYQHIDEVVNDLLLIKNGRHGDISTHELRRYKVAQSWSRKRRIASLIVALILGGVIATFFLAKQNDQLVVRGEKESRRSIAVIGFKNLSGQDEIAWLSTALAEMLTTELAAGNELRTVPGEVIDRMKTELTLSEAVSFGKETLMKIRQNLGTDLVVLGSFVNLVDGTESQIRLDVRLQDTIAGETVASLAETGNEKELFKLISRAGVRLREVLGVSELDAATSIALSAAYPQNVEATRLYALGIEKLRFCDANAARELLESVTQEVPDFVLAHSALAEAWHELGYDKKAQESAKRAFELSTNLPGEERLLVEGLYREMSNDWEEAIQTYQTLWHDYPDNLEYGLLLATTQTNAGQAKEAFRTIDELQTLPAPASLDARIDLVESMAAEAIGNFRRKQTACVAARTKAIKQGALVLVGRSWFNEGWSLYMLGEPEKALAAYDEAKRLFELTGHRSRVADVLNLIGIVNRAQGDLDVAGRFYAEALAIKRETGDQMGIAIQLNNLAIVAKHHGDLAAAKELYEESLAIRRELDNKARFPVVMNNLGNVLRTQGNLKGAQELYEEAITIAREVGSKYHEGLALCSLHIVHFERGDLTVAEKIAEQALGIFREIGHKRLIATTLYGLGDVYFYRGDLATARVMFDSTLIIREEIEADEIISVRNAIALTLLEEGRYAETEVWLRESEEHLEESSHAEEDALSHALLARALAGQDKLIEAMQMAEKAASAVADNPDVRNRLKVNIVVAETRADAGDAEGARKMLLEALQEAEKMGFTLLHHEARFVSSNLELRYGDATAGRRALLALQEDAWAKGLGLIARKAADAAKEDN